jgi:porphobilinogen synthase
MSILRMRRSKRTEALRRMAAETRLHRDDLILPLFVTGGIDTEEPIAALPGVSRWSVDRLPSVVAPLTIPAVLLFGVPDPSQRDATGSLALRSDGLVPQAIRAIKQARPDLAVLTDVCVCGYTDHGHCGLLNDDQEVDNDATLPVLAAMAVAHSQAGADMVAPSAMMDGQVGAIRAALDAAGLEQTGILAYAAKFASCFYGPFRDAAKCAPGFGDRKSYQGPPANRREAIRDALGDEQEGADWLMVKPAMPYLDVLSELRRETRLPLAAYQVSGEAAMLHHAAQAGALDRRAAILESLLCIKRSGADAIITYFAHEVSQWITD